MAHRLADLPEEQSPVCSFGRDCIVTVLIFAVENLFQKGGHYEY